MQRLQHARRFLAYLWMLVRRSFHGTLRTLEIGEALVALAVHVAGYFLPRHKEELEVLFVVLVGLLLLTFFFGLFLAAYAAQCEEVKKQQKVEEQLAAERARSPQLPDAREARVRAQIDKLTRAELLALKHLVECVQLTEAKMVEFCEEKKLELVTPVMLGKKVYFLTVEPTLAAWSVLPRMESIVSKVLAEVNG